MRSNPFTPSTKVLYICLSILISCARGLFASAGDREPGTTVVLPSGVFYHNGGVVIDVTQPPFNAAGDGQTDDTAALVGAYDVIANLVRSVNQDPNHSGTPVPEISYTIYLPDGEYLVSDTIQYSDPIELWTTTSAEVQIGALNGVHFIGESREGTIIQLADYASGFESGQQKPVLTMNRVTVNNVETNNLVANLTINTGTGNPGAIGLDHSGANMSSIRNLSIVSGDGQGVAGIGIFTNPTLGYHSDITIDGFDFGIWMEPYHATHNSFEYVTLIRQNEAAIVLDDSTCSLRKILVEECGGPAILQREEGSQTTAIDCDFTSVSGGIADPAVEIQNGAFTSWNLEQSGFGSGILVDNTVRVTGNIESFTEPAAQYFPPESTGLILPEPTLIVVDEPSISYPTSASDWALVEDYMSAAQLSDPNADCSTALQSALNSGKSHIGFSGGRVYQFSGSFTIPHSVQVINGFFSTVEDDGGQFLKVSANSTTPLIIENIRINGASPAILHSQTRTLCLRMLGGQSLIYNNNTQNNKKLFVTNCTNWGNGSNKISNQQVWARSVNNENPNGPCYEIKNTLMWVFGYKTEKHESSFYAKDDSFLEVFGGVSNQFTQTTTSGGYSPNPMFHLEDSRGTLTTSTNGPSTNSAFGFEDLLNVEQEGNSWTYDVSGAPLRIGRNGQYFLPLSIISDYTDFAIKRDIGTVDKGIAATDSRTGDGYILWSEENVFSRFTANPPHSYNSEHLIAVVWDGTTWNYDNDSTLVPFNPHPNDLLLASVDFAQDTLLSLQGSEDVVYGIPAGFLSGDLSFVANQWAGITNMGEFTVSGTFVYSYDPMDPLTLDDSSVSNYSSQSDPDFLSMTFDETSVQLEGNVWIKHPFDYPVSANTRLEVTVNSSDAGEIIAIGLDEDNDYSNANRNFILGGTQSPSGFISATPEYVPGSGDATYVIPIGEYFTGDIHYITLIADDDADHSTDVIYSNLHLYEAPPN